MIWTLPRALGIGAFAVVLAAGGPGALAQTTTAPGSAPIAAPEMGPALPTVATKTAYKIRQGDEITLTVYGEASLTPLQPLRVLPGGAVAVPLVGNVNVAGLTTTDAALAIGRSLQHYLRDPRVTVALFSVAPIEALVLGNVRSPGKYILQPPAKLTDVLAAAGGLNPIDGDFPDARVEAADGTVENVSLQKLLHDGDTSQNVAVVSGASIYVAAPTTYTVQVFGAVEKPGDITVREGDGVAMAIARAGTSATQNPDLNHVTVTRRDATGKTSMQTVNIYDIVKKGDLSRDVIMQKNDLVFVPATSQHQNGSAIGDVLITLRRLVFPF